MRAPESEEGSKNSERPQHKVHLSPFLMRRYPVTQAQWRVIEGYDRVERDLEP